MWLEGQGAEVTGGQRADLGLVHGVDTRISPSSVHFPGSTLHLSKQRAVLWVGAAFLRPHTGL